MLEFLDNPYDGDENDTGPDLQGEVEGEDLQSDYMPDFKPIHFIDPGVVVGIIGLVDKEIISKEEAREVLGFDTPEA